MSNEARTGILTTRLAAGRNAGPENGGGCMVKVLLSGEGPIINGTDEALITRYVSIGKRPTTFRLEAFTWNLFCAIARRQNLTVNELCSDLAEVTAADSDLAAAIRCYVVGDILTEQFPLDLLSPQLRDMIEKPLSIQ